MALAAPTAQPHLAWVFALQGANQTLSAFSTARLDAARSSRDPSEKSPCATCIRAASGLGFRPPGCEPKPVRFFLPQDGGILSGHELGSRSQRLRGRSVPSKPKSGQVSEVPCQEF